MLIIKGHRLHILIDSSDMLGILAEEEGISHHGVDFKHESVL